MLIVVSLVLAAGLVVTAVRKLSGAPAVVESYRRVGVPASRLPALAAILLAGAAGLVLGLWWRPVGLAAAVGLVLYFALAVVAHVRHRDRRPLPVPVTFLALSLVALAVHLS